MPQVEDDAGNELSSVRTYDTNRFRFATGAAGGPISYRPNEILIRSGSSSADVKAVEQLVNEVIDPNRRPSVRDQVAAIWEAFRALLAWLRSGVDDDARRSRLDDIEEGVADPTDSDEPQARARPRLVHNRKVNDRWSVFVPEAGEEIDPVELARVLKAGGVTAQPNYIRFIDTVRSAPNYIAPNYIAPNYIAPNYIAPNYIAPNYIASGPGAAGNCGCEACPDAPHVERAIPPITAQRAYGPIPGPAAATLHDDIDIEIHVLDVRFQAPRVLFDDLVTPLDAHDYQALRAAVAAGLDDRVLVNPAGADPDITGRSLGLLPLLRRLIDAAADPDIDDKVLRAAALEFLIEPTSEGNGANVNDDGMIDPATNHAEFIQGIVDRIVLATDGSSLVRHHAIAGTLGDVSDEDLALSIDRVVEEHTGTDGQLRIMNLSLSGYTDDDRPPEAVADSVAAAHEAGWLIVASAGNDGSCRLAWPAALEHVVSVAAYGPCGPAFFSNHGPWVDACGPGVDVVSKFSVLPTSHELKVQNEPKGVAADANTVEAHFLDSGYASWSGTSFSAPYVAAMLAARISKDVATSSAVTIEQRVDTALLEMITHDDLIRFPGYGTIVSSEAVRVVHHVERDSNSS